MMSRYCFISAILVILSIANGFHSLSHRIGNDQMGSKLHEQNLFIRNTPIAQNYTIAYKYLNSGTSGVILYVQFDVIGAQQTNASIDFSRSLDVDKYRSVNATVHIQNATDFISTIQIKGLPGFEIQDMSFLNLILEQKIIKSRSSALICTEQSKKELRDKKRIYEFGTRKPEDFLIHFQTEYSTAKKSIRPTFTYNFQDSQVNITYLVLTSNSPWAIVFHNKIVLTEHQFRATVYGLNKKSFSTELIIFGTRK